jgi:hypothetical protein
MSQKLIEYLPDLITHFECVIIPEFGGFISEKTGASINSLGTIQAPTKSILFNPQLNHNDGLVANYIAQKENISYNEAIDLIKSEVDQFYEEIEKTGVLKINKIGEFRSLNDYLVFKADDRENYLIESFGLSSLDTKAEPSVERKINIVNPTSIEEKTIEQPKSIEKTPEVIIESKPVEKQLEKPEEKQESKIETKVEVKEEIKPEQKPEIKTELKSEAKPEPKKENIPTSKLESKEEPKKNGDGNIIKAIVVIVILLIVGLSMYTFRDNIFKEEQKLTTVDTLSNQNNSLKILEDTLNQISTQLDSTADVVPATTDQATEVQAAAVVRATSKNHIVEIVDTSSNSKTKNIYCIGAASFRNEKDALTEKTQLEMIGFTAEIIAMKNATRYQVIIGKYESYQEAVNELKFAKKIDKKFYLLTVKENK